MLEVPAIDISKALKGSFEDRKAIAKEIDSACRTLGFFSIKGHGIDKSIFEDAYDSLTKFFELPSEAKMQCTTEKRPCWYQVDGYNPPLGESANALMGKEGPRDYVEKFSMGRSILDDSNDLPFPEDESCKDLRKNMKRYFEACNEMADILMPLVALALDLPEDHFVGKFDQAWNNLRWHTYPAQPDDLDHDTGVGAHTDTSIFTFVTDTSDGLEVQSKSGEWISVKTTSLDQFIINIGDLMMYWTNDAWVSNLHRVRLSNKARQTMVFILFANDDTMIDTFKIFLDENGKSKYEPMTNAEFIEMRARQMYGDEFIDSGLGGDKDN
jgi:isopenicillin N synthase-like dioxygenase